MTKTQSTPQPLPVEALEAVTGGATGAGDDSVRGGSGNDFIYGRDGNDSIAGDAGDDMLDGGNGNDLVMGNSGDDIITGGSGDDVLIGGTGDDMLDGGNGNDVIRWHPGDGDDTIYGGRGTDQLVLEIPDMNLWQLFNCIVRDSGSPPPVLGPHSIDLTGVSGVIRIYGETVRFSGMESLVTGSYQHYSGREE